MADSLPRPSGTSGPGLSDRLPDWLGGLYDMLVGNIEYFFAGVIVALFIKILINRLSRRRKQIEKLWKLVLFFLSKRQMMIPLVISLGRKKKLLEQSTIDQLIAIRSESEKYPLRKSPVKRMEVESQISHILFEFFQELEQKGELTKNRRFAKMAEDLEFIDQKLVELQLLYNREAKRWNSRIRFSWILKEKMYPFTSLELFRLPQ